MDDEQLAQAAARTTVFAKLTPLHKERIVKLLRRQGTWWALWATALTTRRRCARPISASPSIRRWISPRKRRTSSCWKKPDGAGAGVIEGRRTFANMLKYIKMTASSNFGNVFSVLIASAFLPFLPMLPLHLLIQNLMYDISQIAIPFDNVDDDQITQPQRWNSADLGRFMVFFGPISSIFDVLTFSLMWWVFKANTPEMQTLFQSGWFVEGLLSQTLIVHMIRTRKIPFIQSRPSWPLCIMTLAVIATGIGLVFSPLASCSCRRCRSVTSVAGADPRRLHGADPVRERLVRAPLRLAITVRPLRPERATVIPSAFFTATVGHLFCAESLSTALAVFPCAFQATALLAVRPPPVT